jgi:hypothetical protein
MPDFSCQSKSDCVAKGLLDCVQGKCVQCLVNTDCPGSLTCGAIGGFCTTCQKDADCTISGVKFGTGKCDPELLSCLRCDTDGDCLTSGMGSTLCGTIPNAFGTTSRVCLGCKTDSDCAKTTRKGCDSKAGTCSLCRSDADCAALSSTAGVVCNLGNGKCECTTDQQCQASFKAAYVACVPY